MNSPLTSKRGKSRDVNMTWFDRIFIAGHSFAITMFEKDLKQNYDKLISLNMFLVHIYH